MKRLLTALLLVLLSACQEPDGTRHGAQPVVGLSVSTRSTPFFQALVAGARMEAGQQGVVLQVSDAGNDPDRQKADIAVLLDRKVDVLLVNPVDAASLVPVLRIAQARGVAVVSLDRTIPGVPVAAHVASDNIAGGMLVATYLQGRLGPRARLVELEGLPGASATRERGDGFHQLMDGKPGMLFIARESAGFDRAQAHERMQSILLRAGVPDAVFAHNDEMALGALAALREAGHAGVTVVGFDAIPEARAAVKDGVLDATVAQQPEIIGRNGVQLARKLADGETVDRFVPVPLQLLTRSRPVH